MKSLKKSLLLVIIVTSVFAQSAYSQSESKFTLGVLGGINIPKLSSSDNNELSRDYTSRTGEAFGLTASYIISPKLSIRGDLLYSSEGGKRDGFQAIPASDFIPLAPEGTYVYATFKNESILNYLEVPVMVKYSIPVCPSSKIYVNMGAYVGFLLNATQKTRGTSDLYLDRTQTILAAMDIPFDANTDVKSDICNVNFGLTGGIGYSRKFSFGTIFLDIRGAYGLTVIQKDSKNGESHIGNLLIAAGYSIPL